MGVLAKVVTRRTSAVVVAITAIVIVGVLRALWDSDPGFGNDEFIAVHLCREGSAISCSEALGGVLAANAA